jgi:hypothetical protein
MVVKNQEHTEGDEIDGSYGRRPGRNTRGGCRICGCATASPGITQPGTPEPTSGITMGIPAPRPPHSWALQPTQR